jgi:hypothetical protein
LYSDIGGSYATIVEPARHERIISINGTKKIPAA